jgi:hypothetical protein
MLDWETLRGAELIEAIDWTVMTFEEAEATPFKWDGYTFTDRVLREVLHVPKSRIAELIGIEWKTETIGA